MTNYEKWCCYTSKFTSPQAWIDYGFYYMIGAALQRRVWYYDSTGNPLYCNPYVVFVGPPGSGKGLVLGSVAQFLKHHKYEKGNDIKTNIGYEKPPLFCVGADSITYEELLADVARSIRRIPVPSIEGKHETYTHTSYAFVLEEMASLFKRKSEDAIKFLQNAYDCKDYDYKTKHQGKDLLRRLCVSFLAGTQQDFLKECRASKIFGQGFASRTLFLFESKERFTSFHISDLSPEQKQAREDLLVWLKRLSALYGQINYSEETAAYLEAWWTVEKPRLDAMPTHMQDYAGRKKVIMLKLAAAKHFAEHISLTIPTETFSWSIESLRAIEPQMEAGLGMSGRNEMHFFTRKIYNFIKSRGKVTMAAIVVEFGSNMTLTEIEIALRELELGYGLKTGQESSKKFYYL